MTEKWKDRIIRGGVIVVGTMGIIGAMAGLTGIMAWYPGIVRPASSSSSWPPASDCYASQP